MFTDLPNRIFKALETVNKNIFSFGLKRLISHSGHACSFVQDCVRDSRFNSRARLLQTVAAPVMSAPRYDRPWFRLDRAKIRGEIEGWREGSKEGGS